MRGLVREMQFIQEVTRLRKDLSELQEEMQELIEQSMQSPGEVESMDIADDQDYKADPPKINSVVRHRLESKKDI